MGYSTGLLKEHIKVLNREAQTVGVYGVDSAGIGWTVSACLYASVDWARGKSAMNAGALDAYAVVIVRMRWTSKINMRSRIEHNGVTYQIIPETFHEDFQGNTIQFQAQAIVNEDTSAQ